MKISPTFGFCMLLFLFYSQFEVSTSAPLSAMDYPKKNEGCSTGVNTTCRECLQASCFFLTLSNNKSLCMANVEQLDSVFMDEDVKAMLAPNFDVGWCTSQAISPINSTDPLQDPLFVGRFVFIALIISVFAFQICCCFCCVMQKEK